MENLGAIHECRPTQAKRRYAKTGSNWTGKGVCQGIYDIYSKKFDLKTFLRLVKQSETEVGGHAI